MAAVNLHVPPAPGVTEIRVHGVGGTPPEALLEQTGVHQVAGDDTAGFFQGVLPEPSRSVEAYSWGGLTARNTSRALWVLLLPFALINLSGWMIEPHASPDKDAYGNRSDLGTRVHEALVQLVAILSTAMYVMWTTLVTMNTMAFQCGAIPQCHEGRWYLEIFNYSFFLDHPGRRVVVGLVPALGLLVLFTVLSSVSRTRYEDYGRSIDKVAADSVRLTGTALGRHQFWLNGDWQRASTRLHIGCCVLILAGLLGRAVGEFERALDVHVASEAVGWWVFVAAVGIALAAVGALVVATLRSRPLLGDDVPWFGRVSWGVLAASLVLLAVSVQLTWRLDAPDDRLLGPLDAALGGGADVVTPTTDYWGFGWAPVILLTLAVIGVGVISVVQSARWVQRRFVHLDQWIPVAMLIMVTLWDVAVPTAIVLAVTSLLIQWRQAHLEARDPDARVAPTAVQTWRTWLAMAFLAAAGLLAWLTHDMDAPYGPGWPRLTPLLAFTVVLIGLNLVQANGRLNRAERAPARVSLVLIVVPAAIILAGWLLAGVSGRDEWLHAAAGVAWVATATVWLAQFEHRGWRWNGPGAVALMALSVLMGAFSGLVIWIVDLLDGGGEVFVLSTTAIYRWLTLILAMMVVALVTGVAAWWPVATLGPGNDRDPDAQPTTAERFAMTIRAIDVVVTVAAMTSVSSLVALGLHLARTKPTATLDWLNDGPPEAWAGVVSVAAWASLGIAVIAVFSIRRGLRDPSFRAKSGILWDVASFWPRSFHPFAPPSYAARAVPELQRRLAEIARADGGHRATRKHDPPVSGTDTPTTSEPADRGAAILSGHSQGSVLSIAAIATLKPEFRERVWLVTHGSPSSSLYRRFFPSYFPDTLFDYCAGIGDEPPIPQGRWLNYYRPTDPIGGPCFDNDLSPEDVADAPGWSRVAMERSRDDRRRLPDVRLHDPVMEEPSPYRPKPRPRGHSGYMADPAMREALDVLARHLS